jgi:hypothetical protein
LLPGLAQSPLPVVNALHRMVYNLSFHHGIGALNEYYR